MLRNLEPLTVAPEFAAEVALAIERRTLFRRPELESSAVAPTLYLDGVLTPWRLADLRKVLVRYVEPTADKTPLVLWINSPGGLVEGTPETFEIVRRVAAVRPVHVVAEGYLASGAFWIASAATRVTCSPSCKVGSVGVVSALLDDTVALSLAGLRLVVIATAEAKKLGYSGVPVDEAMERQLEGSNAAVLSMFARDLLRSGRFTPAKLKEAVKAEVHWAENALHLGWIDEVALVEDAVAKINGTVVDRFDRLHGERALAKLDELTAAAAGTDAGWKAPPEVRARIEAEYPALAANAEEERQRISRR